MPARHVTIQVNSQSLSMELDTGSAHTVNSEAVWKYIGRPALKTGPRLTAYGGSTLSVVGSARVVVRFKEHTCSDLQVVVVESAST